MRKNVYLAAVLGLGIVMLAGCGGSGSGSGMQGAEGTAAAGAGTAGKDADTDKRVPAGGEKSSAGEETGAAEKGTGEKVTVKVLQFKTELSEQMNAMAADYMKENPDVDLQIESVISSDYDTVLKTRFASGEAPDIFNNEGYNKMTLWLDNLEDLSDQPWIADMLDFTKEGITTDGKIYGMPLYLESYGFLYNKDYFEQAGIAEIPVTLTALKEAVKKLEAAGIPAFSVNGAEWYPNGVFFANVPMAQQENPTDFIRQLNEGTATFTDNKLYQDWIGLVELQRDHAESDPMSVDFSTVVSDFANGKAAMILGTNGYQPMVDEVNPELNTGLMPMPINDDAALNDKIYAAASTYWCVNKKSESKEAAKEFLNWLVTSETGKNYVTKEFGFIPGLKSVKADENAVGLLGVDTQKYIDAGKIAGWEWPKYPDGATVELGGAIQKFYAKEIDGPAILDSFQVSWDDMKNN